MRSLLVACATAGLWLWPTALAAQTPTTDMTLPMTGSGRLDVVQCMGLVTVRPWDRQEVRIRAEHSRRTAVRTLTRGQVVVVGPDGPPADIDYTIDLPAGAGVRLEGIACSADVEGLSGALAVETVEGTVIARGLSGSVDVTTVDGDVTVDGGRGALHLHSVDGAIVVTNATGDVEAASIDGDVRLTNVRSSSVEVSTVDGDVYFSGPLDPQGRYDLTTHDGNVDLVVPAGTSASLTVRTFENRQVQSDLPLTLVSGGGRGRRQLYTIGSGAADVEIETFDGRVRIQQLPD